MAQHGKVWPVFVLLLGIIGNVAAYYDDYVDMGKYAYPGEGKF